MLGIYNQDKMVVDRDGWKELVVVVKNLNGLYYSNSTRVSEAYRSFSVPSQIRVE